MEKAFSTLLRSEISLVGAGRTDAGVHAADHIEDTTDLIYKLNSFLPEDIAVQAVFKVGSEAHARFDATERTYEYWVTQEKNPFYTDAAHYVKHQLEISKMNEAAALLIDTDDFECFSKSHTEVHTYLCDVTIAHWKRQGDLLVFTITANRFLRNMVRAIVGTLLDVGTQKSTLADVKSIINSKDRSEAGYSVPAKG